ncbi:MAG: integration host factor subunit beta [Desulfobulbaceae bacterium]|nr:integration host factor subunit beta [Desulfobulbaceae bacterium]
MILPSSAKTRKQHPITPTCSREARMNKSELIEALAQEINISHKEATAITNTVIDAMTDALARGDSIEIRGFGSFVIKRYGSYDGRNPKTGKQITVKPKKLPFFKVGKELRERVNNGQ